MPTAMIYQGRRQETRKPFYIFAVLIRSPDHSRQAEILDRHTDILQETSFKQTGVHGVRLFFIRAEAACIFPFLLASKGKQTGALVITICHDEK